MAHTSDQPDTPQPETDLPAGLATLLREHTGADRPLDAGEAGVERRIDDTVMRAAREHLGQIDPPRPLRFPTIVRTVTGLTLAAAAIGIVVYFGPAPKGNTPTGTTRNSVPSDRLAHLSPADEADGHGARHLDNAFTEDELADAAEAEPSEHMELRRRASGVSAAPTLALSDSASKVTIRDAYVLALALEAGDTVDAAFDETGDGVVNGDDVDALARTAVRLNEPRGFGSAPPVYAPTLGVFFPAPLTNGSVMP